MPKVLIVEDDQDLAQMIANHLTCSHYLPQIVETGEDGLQHLEQFDYDLAVIDWALPEMSGLELCKQYRRKGGSTPILILTGKSRIEDKTDGLDSGADDYLTKPFDLREFDARLRALLRRGSKNQASDLLEFGDIKLDIESYKVTRAGASIKLIPKEFRLLEVLMRSPGKVMSPEELMNKVWSADEQGSAESVRVHIKNLRKKLSLSDGGPCIETVHGVGYRLAP